MGTPKTRTTVGTVSALIGAWLLVTPFVFGIGIVAAWHLYFWGVVVMILGAYQVFRAQSGRGPVTGASVGIALVGVWVAVSPLAYVYPQAATINLVLSGLILVGAGVYEANEANRITRPRQA